jgi:hypothetical protein
MRVPGAKEKKVQLLQGLNESTFPYLVADILYFHLNHNSIKVTDGPGDGRRDIISHLQSGERAITQCKYHKDSDKSTGSRELDELPIALTKFDCRHGLFATSGRISPQGKREYIDQYKGFSLTFLEGDEIVDIVVAHPLLNAIWVRNNLISNLPKIIEIPFILRVGNKNINVPVDIQDFNFPSNAIEIKFLRGVFDKPLFHPYREPFIPTAHDFIAGNNLMCDCAEISGNVWTFEIPTLKKAILRNIRNDLPKTVSPFIVRFGKPRLKNYKGEETITVEDIPAESFVIRNDHPIYREKDYIVFKMDGWSYPSRMSALYHDWAGWLNEEANCILFLQILTENKPGLSMPGDVLLHYEMLWLEDSVFCIQKEESQSVAIEKYSSVKPDAIIQICQGVYLIGWLHPYLTEERPNMFSIEYDFDNDCYKWEKEKICMEFSKRTVQAKALINSYGSKQASSDFALAISIDNNTPFVNIKGKFEYMTADLVHFFDQTISPVDLNGRKLLFVSSYKSKLSPDRIQMKIDTLMKKMSISLSFEYVYTDSGETVYHIALTRPCPTELTTNDFVCKEISKIKEYLDQLEIELAGEEIQRISIRKHWKDEIGLHFQK